MSIFPFGTYELTAALIAAAFAGFLRGTTGFGSALVLAPVLAILFDATEAVALSLMLGAFGSLQLLPRYRRHLEVSSVRLLSAAGLLHLLPGVLLLHVIDPEWMRRGLAMTTLATAALLLILPAYEGPRGRGPCAVAGALGGLIMGSTSMGGPPIVLYLMSRPGSAEQQKANVIFVVGALELGAIALLALSGGLNTATLMRFVTMLPVFIAGTFLGERFFRERLTSRYRQVMLFTLIIVGVAALLT